MLLLVVLTTICAYAYMQQIAKANCCGNARNCSLTYFSRPAYLWVEEVAA